MEIDHERDASPLGVLRSIQRQVITPTPDLCMKITRVIEAETKTTDTLNH